MDFPDNQRNKIVVFGELEADFEEGRSILRQLTIHSLAQEIGALAFVTVEAPGGPLGCSGISAAT